MEERTESQGEIASVVPSWGTAYLSGKGAFKLQASLWMKP